ncbi:hypothetical protein PCANC_17739 [Puccinia coronata f. sp. avenae]|uniref:Uncharacterized protein n=1 Tax=Puccinia coronata f. sp. avenae TaxID=200324 RepID=A0A2N5UYZ0_9BASI|nr:hypothetical protein PCANC_17739 [Puccinia coronata f. sp. avenae]
MLWYTASIFADTNSPLAVPYSQSYREHLNKVPRSLASRFLLRTSKTSNQEGSADTMPPPPASSIMDMNIARTAQRFLFFPLANGRANDSGASNRSRSVSNCAPILIRFHAAILDQVAFQHPSNNNTQQTAGFCPTPLDD